MKKRIKVSTKGGSASSLIIDHRSNPSILLQPTGVNKFLVKNKTNKTSGCDHCQT